MDTNPDKAFETGMEYLNALDLKMAGLYFESAAKNYLTISDFRDAKEAYEKLLYCFEMDEENERVKDVKEEIARINKITE